MGKYTKQLVELGHKKKVAVTFTFHFSFLFFLSSLFLYGGQCIRVKSDLVRVIGKSGLSCDSLIICHTWVHKGSYLCEI